MNLEELNVYNLSMEIGENVWSIVNRWDYFAKDVIGKQFAKAADSIAANISEGYGRYHYRENINFCYYSRGSLFETKTWADKSFRRNLLNKEDHDKIITELVTIAKLLNNYVKSIGRNSNSASEPDTSYNNEFRDNDVDIWSNDKLIFNE